MSGATQHSAIKGGCSLPGHQLCLSAENQIANQRKGLLFTARAPSSPSTARRIKVATGYVSDCRVSPRMKLSRRDESLSRVRISTSNREHMAGSPSASTTICPMNALVRPTAVFAPIPANSSSTT